MMKEKFHIYLTGSEYIEVVQARICLKNNLLTKGKYTD